MKSYQQNISKPTEELTASILKAITSQKENNMAIDAYRKAKREMEEAVLREELDEFVAAVVQTEEYKDWLRGALKKDERRKNKKVPADDPRRVKLFITQLKSGLPAVIVTANFTESTDRWGHTGLWRLQSKGYLTGFAVLDADHVPKVEARIEEWLKRDDFKDLGIVWIFITPSGEGAKVVFKAKVEDGNLQDNVYTLAEKLGVLEYADGQTKNSDHAHFIPKYDDIKYIDWEELFTYENPEFEARYGEAYRRGESEPTQPRWQELERQRSEARKKQTGTATQQPAATVAPTQTVSTQQAEAEFSAEDEAFIKVLNEHYGPALPPHTKHERMQTETSHWLCYYNDNDAQKAIRMAYRLDWVKEWNPNPGEVEDLCQSAAKKKLLKGYPNELKELMNKAGINLEELAVVGTKDIDPMADLPFDKWCDKIEKFFDVYPCLREVCEPHPRRLWPFLLFASAAMMGTCMTLCYYKFYANKTARTRLSYIVLGVGDPASGKGTLTRLMDLLLAPILEADAIADEATNQWKESTDASGANKQKELRQRIYNRFFGPRASNGEFIRSMINNKAVVDGEEMPIGCVTVDSEKDNSINMSRSGGWQNRDVMALKAFHTEYDTQHYQNKQSVSGRYRVVWVQIETCTPPTLKRLVNDRNFNSGLDTRMATIPMGKPDFDMMPLDSNEDDLLAYNETLKQWAYKLDQRQGELPLWPLVEHVHKWCDNRRAIAFFNNKDQADWLLTKRVPYYGIHVCAPYVDMRHNEEREQTGTYTIDDTDRELCDLVLDIQYRTQHYWFYELHRKYYDNQLLEAARQCRRTNRFMECFRQLPEEFTTERFAQVFGYANTRAGQKTLQRLEEDKAIKRTKRGNYKKLVSEL